MARHTIFKTRKPRQYNYNPRYYDPVEDEVNARVQHARGSATDRSTEAIKSRIRAGFNGSSYSMNRKFKRDLHRKSNKRVLVIAVLLTAVIAFFVVKNIEVIAEWMY